MNINVLKSAISLIGSFVYLNKCLLTNDLDQGSKGDQFLKIVQYLVRYFVVLVNISLICFLYFTNDFRIEIGGLIFFIFLDFLTKFIFPSNSLVVGNNLIRICLVKSRLLKCLGLMIVFNTTIMILGGLLIVRYSFVQKSLFIEMVYIEKAIIFSVLNSIMLNVILLVNKERLFVIIKFLFLFVFSVVGVLYLNGLMSYLVMIGSVVVMWGFFVGFIKKETYVI